MVSLASHHFLGLRDHIQCASQGVDDGGPGDADFRHDVGAQIRRRAVDVPRGNRGDSLAGINETHPPQLADAAVVGVEGVDAVMLRRDEHHIAEALPRNRDVREIQRLGVDVSIDRIGKEPLERAGGDVARGESRFAQILTGARPVVVIGQDTIRQGAAAPRIDGAGVVHQDADVPGRVGIGGVVVGLDDQQVVQVRLQVRSAADVRDLDPHAVAGLGLRSWPGRKRGVRVEAGSRAVDAIESVAANQRGEQQIVAVLVRAAGLKANRGARDRAGRGRKGDLRELRIGDTRCMPRPAVLARPRRPRQATRLLGRRKIRVRARRRPGTSFRQRVFGRIVEG